MSKGLQEGEKAPEFCLQDEFGDKVCLDEQKGKWVVLYFYPKDDTPGCTQEAKDFSCMLTDFGQKNAVVIGVSGDSSVSHHKFRLKHNLDVRLLSDPGHDILKLYGAWGEKNLYGKLVQGITRSTYLIDPNGKIAHAWPKVSVKGHVANVLLKIDELSGK